MRRIPPGHDLGILFVHGIGEQTRGDTLLQFAEPLVRWLNGWLTKRGNEPPTGSAKIDDARLAGGDDREPAHASVDITIDDPRGIAPRSQRWLLAEARWAEAARTPKFSALARWLLTTGSWLILSHALRPVRTLRASRWRWLKTAQAAVLALVFAPLMQLVVVVLVVAAALPVPSLRAALARALLRIASTIGDSYVLVESELQRQAITTTARRSLEWLAERCDRVIVIAHSQGAAVAHRVLRHPDPKNVSLFISYGSGLGKLEELLLMARQHAWKLTLATYAMPASVIAGLVALRIFTAYPDEPFTPMVLMLCLFPLMLLVLTVSLAVDMARKLDTHLAALSFAEVRPGLRWVDLYATADLVPNGPLATSRVAGLTTRRVTNFKSIVSDHTSYWLNRAEFIPLVLKHVNAVASLRLFEDRDVRRRLLTLAREHRRRVQWLFTLRWIGLASAALVIFAFRSSLEALGRGGLQALRVEPFGTIGNVLAGAGRTLAAAIAALTGMAVPDVRHWLYVIGGSILILLTALLWHRLVHWLWSAAERAHVSWRIRPATMPALHPADRKIPDAITAMAGVVPLVIALGATFWPRMLPGSPAETEVMLYRTIAGGLLAGYVALFVAAIVLVFRPGATDTPLRDRIAGVVVSSLVLLILGSQFLSATLETLIWDTLLTVIAAVITVGALLLAVRTFWTRLEPLHPTVRLLAIALPAAGAMGIAWVASREPGYTTTAEALFYGPVAVFLFLLFLAYQPVWVVRRVKKWRSTKAPEEPPAASVG